MIREFVLQMKLGRVAKSYFREKFGVAVEDRFAEPFEVLRAAGLISIDNGTVRLSRDGLLQVDALLPSFFKPEHRVSRKV